jgi:hypothetical protein
MKNVRKVRVFECVDWIEGHKDSPAAGGIYSEDYTWGIGVITVGEIYDANGEGRFKLLGTIEVDCTPPTVEETPLPKKRRFKLINGEGWSYTQGEVYDEDYGSVLLHATKGIFAEDWQEVFEQEENIPLPIYPDPIYLSYDDAVRGMWYDVREVLPDEGFDDIEIVAEYDGDKLDTLDVEWDNDFGGFIGYFSGEGYEKITKWMLPK